MTERTKTDTQAELWTVDDLAAAWQVSPRTIRMWQQDRTIPYLKIGRLVRFVPADMRAFALASKHERS